MSHDQKVKESLKKKLRGHPGVVRVDFIKIKRRGGSADGIRVDFCDQESLEKAKLPSKFEGVAIVSEVAGRIKVR